MDTIIQDYTKLLLKFYSKFCFQFYRNFYFVHFSSDGDYEWSDIATDKAKKLLANTLLHDSKDHGSWVCKGSVFMNVGDVIWISDITVHKLLQSLPGSQSTPCGKLKSHLLKDGWAEENPEHMNRLAPKARTSGFCVYYKGDMEDSPRYGPIRANPSVSLNACMVPQERFKEERQRLKEQQDALKEDCKNSNINKTAEDNSNMQLSEGPKNQDCNEGPGNQDKPREMQLIEKPGNQDDKWNEDPGNQADVNEAPGSGVCRTKAKNLIKQADEFANPTYDDVEQRGGECVPLPDDSGDLSSVSFSKGDNIKTQQHKFVADIEDMPQEEPPHDEPSQKQILEAKPPSVCPVKSPEPKRLATIKLPENMPSLSVVKGVTGGLEKLSSPKVLWSVQDGKTVLKVNLMKFEQECGKAEYYVRVTRRSVKLQFLTIKRPGVVSDNGDGKNDNYLYADLPILWLKSHVKPKDTEVNKAGFTLTVTLSKVDSLTEADKNPFCESLMQVDTPPK